MGPDPFEVVEAYVRLRLEEDPHLWPTALFDEVAALGYGQSYVTFARKIRSRGLRPVCAACSGTRGRAVAIIDHPPGEECQWDWLELRDTPWGSGVFVMVGVLSRSGKFANTSPPQHVTLVPPCCKLLSSKFTSRSLNLFLSSSSSRRPAMRPVRCGGGRQQ